MQLSKELELRGQLEQLKGELAPMEKLKLELDSRSTTQSNLAMWMGMGFTSLMFGFFARLTWWEYSWDIMEPVTYFWTYGTTMAMFAYFLITRQVRRMFLLSLSLSLSHSLTLPPTGVYVP